MKYLFVIMQYLTNCQEEEREKWGGKRRTGGEVANSSSLQAKSLDRGKFSLILVFNRWVAY